MKGLALCVIAALMLGVPAASAASPADVYAAIRGNDLARLKTLVVDAADANAPGAFGQSPLMSAAVAGSLDAMRLLITAGANVNAQNPLGTTALMMSVTDLAKVRLLLERGADPNVASKQGRTALFLAAMCDHSAEIVRVLLAKGADAKIKDAFGNNLLNAAASGNDVESLKILLAAGLDVNAGSAKGSTPLLAAVYHNNAAAAKLLLASGAKVNVASLPGMVPGPDPKSGPIALTNVTPLLQAAAVGSLELVRTLLDAGADVNAKDGRGMTPLMLAVARTHQNPDVIGLLLARHADTSAQSGVGETAGDWARKTGSPEGLALLKVSRAATPAATPAVTSAAVDARTAAERALSLLETSSQKFFDGSGCVSCHHQNATDLAFAEARARGMRVDTKAAVARVAMNEQGPPPLLLLERVIIDVPEIFAATMTALAAVDGPPSPTTDIIAAHLAAAQSADGSWHLLSGIGHRPPTADGDITRAALCLRALSVYGPPARSVEMRARIENGRRWLLAAQPTGAEERNMQILGLLWAGADAATLTRLAAPIAAMQQADGGWKQHDGLATDAYATGQSLYVLAKVGALATTGEPYRKGVDYLLATQAETGAWRVASRAPKFQAYFNSGFPYGGDQWISAWATSWATMALAQVVAR